MSTNFGNGDISLWDYAVNRVAKALDVSTHEGERVALSWEGNVSFDAFKLLEAARKNPDVSLGDPSCKECGGYGYHTSGSPNMYERGSQRSASLCTCTEKRIPKP